MRGELEQNLLQKRAERLRAEEALAEAELEEAKAELSSGSLSPSQDVERTVPIEDTAVFNVARLQRSLIVGAEQLVPATCDTLEEDIGEVIDREEKATSSSHFDSPAGQAEVLLEPGGPAASCKPPAPWEGSPGVTVDWSWRMAEPSAEPVKFDIVTPRPIPTKGDNCSSGSRDSLVRMEVERLERALEESKGQQPWPRRAW